MSKELKNITGAVMDRIHQGKIKMRPRVYFIIGSLLTFIGLVASMLTSVFLVGLIRFSFRSHGPMGEYRLDQLLSNFPWWTAVIAIVGLVIGIWLLRRYDFSYKINFKVMIFGIIVAIIMTGLVLDMTGLNDVLLRRGPMRGMMKQYLQENNIQPGVGWGGRNNDNFSDKTRTSMMGDISRHFIEQMIPHHDDAIMMAEIALTKAEHPEIKQLAEDIKRTQSEENAVMREWYKTWYGINVPDTVSTGRGIGGRMMMSGGMMGGAMDIDTLKSAKPFDKAFIEQMIPHHQMAVMMANMVLNGSDRPLIKELAKNIITAQTKEIESMRAWYSSWYGN